MLVLLDGDSTACACDPTMAVELVAEGADVVCWMQRVGRRDERIVAAGGSHIGRVVGGGLHNVGHYGCFHVAGVRSAGSAAKIYMKTFSSHCSFLISSSTLSSPSLHFETGEDPLFLPLSIQRYRVLHVNRRQRSAQHEP